MKKKTSGRNVVENRRARFDYDLGDEIVVGMVLSGPEVRAIRDNHAQLKGSFVNIRNGELWLENLTLGADNIARIKLIATKKQIATLIGMKSSAGYTIVPTKLYPKSRYIKLGIAPGRGKKRYDKRESIKNRDIDRGRF